MTALPALRSTHAMYALVMECCTSTFVLPRHQFHWLEGLYEGSVYAELALYKLSVSRQCDGFSMWLL